MTSKEKQTLRRQVAKLLVIRASGHNLDSLREYPQWELPNYQLQKLLEDGVGGVILHGGTFDEIQHRCAQLKSWSSQPIFLCADVEEGVGQRFQGGSWLPPPMALGMAYQKDSEEALKLAEEYGVSIGREARQCGLNWVLAPVCDVNTNPLNPVINMRSWSESPNAVKELTSAFLRGLTNQGVLGCAKHFPGHGDTSVDSHLELPVLNNDLPQLKDRELIPFKALIKDNVSSVMSAHLFLKKIDPIYPVTFSKKVLTHLLREEIGFQGLIITDALVMQAITKNYKSINSSSMAFEAGADLILMPEDAHEAIDSIVDLLISGRVSIRRLEESLERRNKALKHLDNSTDSIARKSHNPYDQASQEKEISCLSRKLIDISLECRNNIDISRFSRLINLIRVDDFHANSIVNRSSPALNIPHELGCINFITHSLGVSPWQNNSDEPLALDRFGDGSFLLQLFVRGNPFKGDAALREPWIQAVKQLQQNKRLAALIVYGSSYFWNELSAILEPSIPAAFCPAQMPLAQKKILEILFGSSIESEEFLSQSQFEFIN